MDGAPPPGVPLPGADPVMSQGMASAYAQQMLMEQVNAARESMMVVGQFNQNMRGAVASLASLAGDIDTIRRQVQASSRTTPGLGLPTPSSSGGGIPSAMPEGMPVGSGPQSAPPMSFAEGREIGQNLRMGDVAQRAAGMAAQFMEDRATTISNTRVDENGLTVPEMADFGNGPEPAYVERDAQGNIVNTFANAAAAGKAYQWANRRGYVTGALSRFSSGAGAMGALGGTLARVAGPVGIAVGVGTAVANQVAKQTAAGAEFRAAYGEDAGRFAIGERFDRTLAGWEGFFKGVGSERAKEDYSIGVQYGMTGDTLDRSVDFSRDMYTRYGLDSGQAMGLAQTAREAGLNLDQFAEQIGRVSKAAVEAGRNSTEAIARFQALAQGLATSITDTPAAFGLAETITDTVAAMPQSMQDAGIDQGLAGMLSNPMNIAMQANAMGTTYSDLSNQMQLDTSGNIQRQVLSGSIDAMLSAVLGTVGLNLETFRTQMRERFPGRQALDAPEVARIMQETGLSIVSMKPIMNQFGFSMATDTEYMTFFMNSVLGATDQLDPGTGGGEDLSGQTTEGTAPSPFGGITSSTQNGVLTTNFGGGMSDPIVQGAKAGGAQESYNQYFAQTLETNTRNTALESLFRQAEEFEGAAGVSLDEAKFRMEGSDQEYTLQQIINDPKLLAELSKFTAVGGDDPVSLARYTQSEPEKTGGWDPFAAFKGDGLGTTGSETKVTIGLTEEAKGLLHVTTSESQREGVPDPSTVPPYAYGTQ